MRVALRRGAACSSALLGADLLGVPHGADRRSCPTRTRATSSSHRAGAGGRVARLHDERSRKQAEQILRKAARGRRTMFAVGGFSFSGAAPNQGIDVRAAEGRSTSGAGDEHSAQAVRRPAARPLFGRSPARSSIPFLPPSIHGLGHVRRLPVRAARSDAADRHRRARRAATQQLIGAGQPDAGARRACSRSSPRTIRSSSSTIDREQAQEPRHAARARSPTRCRCSSARRT